jgi:hypothetical protein
MSGIHIPVDAGDEELFQEMVIEQELLFAYRLFQQMTTHVLGYLSLSNRKY